MNLRGVFPPIATPFKDDEIDLDAMRSNVSKWMKTGLAGVLVLGSNGEHRCSTPTNRSASPAPPARRCRKEKTLIVGAGEESTRSTIAAVHRAAEAGADVVLVRTPCYFKNQMTTDLFVRHFTAVADASPVPVLPYNVPGFTGVKLAAEAVATLASHPNIPGVKDSSADLTQIADLVAMTPAGFNVMVGSAPTLYASLCVGATAGIVAVACVGARPGRAALRTDKGRDARRGGGAAAEDHAAGEIGDDDVRCRRSESRDGSTGYVAGRPPAAAARHAEDLRHPAPPVGRAGHYCVGLRASAAARDQTERAMADPPKPAGRRRARLRRGYSSHASTVCHSESDDRRASGGSLGGRPVRSGGASRTARSPRT